MFKTRIKRAPHGGALFHAAAFYYAAALYHAAALFLVGLIYLAPAEVHAQECPADRIDERALVSRVVDGDTLRLQDGRLVRLIGINTPEIGRDGRPSEAYAIEARNTLQALLAETSMQVGLRFGKQRYDRHRRLLAHVYLGDGRSVEARLLQLGLAARILVPPNDGQQECLRRSEAAARQAGLGVWTGVYRPIPVERLAANARGFRILQGDIQEVGQSRNSIWLNFSPGREGVAVRIDKQDLHYFQAWSPADLLGRQIEVRGWMYNSRNRPVMVLRHPAEVSVLSP